MTTASSNPSLISSLEYNNRVLKYVLIPDYLQKLSTHGNLKEALLKVQMMTHDQVIGDFMPNMFTPDIPEETKQKVLTSIRKKTEEENKKKIEEYLPIIFNQTLVTLCTVLDTFLVDSLRVITTHQPKILKALASDDDIKIDDLFTATEQEQLIAKVQEKVLSDFDFMGIKDKLSVLSQKLKVDVEGGLMLKFHKEEVQELYKSKGDFLYDTYDKRNLVVHRDQKAITTFEELSEVSTYISYFILDFGFILGAHFKIETDFGQFLKRKPKGLVSDYEDKPKDLV